MEIKEEKTSMSEAIVKFERVPFMGQDIQVTTEEPHYVALKPLFEGIGMDWSVVYRQVSNDDVLMEGIANLQYLTKGGLQNGMCIPMNMLQGLFFKINAHLYKDKNPELYAIICEYQKECYKVLHDYFTQGVVVNPKMTADDMQRVFDLVVSQKRDLEQQEKMLETQRETIRRMGDGLHEQTVTSIRLQGELMRQKAVVDRFAPVGECPEGYYERRGSYCRKPKRRKVDVAEARQLLLGIPQTKDVADGE